MLTKKQFDLLSELEHSPASTQRMLAKKAGMSLGAVNKTSNELASLGYCENGRITEAGLSALEVLNGEHITISRLGTFTVVLSLATCPRHAEYAKASRPRERQTNYRQPS